MVYKLLATDMDGTLLMNNKVLSQENIEALKRAKEHGVEIVICTGRPYPSVKPYLQQLGFDCWVITNNGAIIRNKQGDIISVVYMKTKALQEVIRLLQEENIYFHVSDENYTYIKSYRERIKNIHRLIIQTGASKLKAYLVSTWHVLFKGSHKKVDFSNFLKENGKAASIFILSSCRQQLQNLSNKLKNINNIDITSSGSDNVEVLDENATKGKALNQLAQMLNIDKERVIAVGDNYNDLSMIEYAGLGVAMENAEKAVIEKANWVTKSNENHGIAYLVKNLIETPQESMKI